MWLVTSRLNCLSARPAGVDGDAQKHAALLSVELGEDDERADWFAAGP